MQLYANFLAPFLESFNSQNLHSVPASVPPFSPPEHTQKSSLPPPSPPSPRTRCAHTWYASFCADFKFINAHVLTYDLQGVLGCSSHCALWAHSGPPESLAAAATGWCQGFGRLFERQWRKTARRNQVSSFKRHISSLMYHFNHVTQVIPAAECSSVEVPQSITEGQSSPTPGQHIRDQTCVWSVYWCVCVSRGGWPFVITIWPFFNHVTWTYTRQYKNVVFTSFPWEIMKLKFRL